MCRITRGIGPHQCEFRKSGSCLTNIISFYERMTWFVDEEKAVNIVYLDLTKAFDAVSPSILLEELSAPGLHRCIVSENCVDG